MSKNKTVIVSYFIIKKRIVAEVYFSKYLFTTLDKNILLFVSFFFILYVCLLAFKKVKATSYIDKQLVPFGDILVELNQETVFRF